MKEFIEALKAAIMAESYEDGTKEMAYRSVISVKSALDIADRLAAEQPKGDWIYCSEKMPEDGQDVLVWFEYFRYGNYNRLFQTHGISWASKGEWSGFVNGQSGWHELRVIAWQPLPAPPEEVR